MRLTRDLAAVLRDPRDPRRVNFTLHELLKQQGLQITSGYDSYVVNDIAVIRLRFVGKTVSSSRTMKKMIFAFATLARLWNLISRYLETTLGHVCKLARYHQEHNQSP